MEPWKAKRDLTELKAIEQVNVMVSSKAVLTVVKEGRQQSPV